MTTVPPDGPVPCDLAFVGESPGRMEVEEGRGFVGPSGRMLWRQEDGDIGLVDAVVGRPRHTCYVSNVCKEPLPETEWRKLAQWQRDEYAGKLIEELGYVEPRVVLAFGTRAAGILVPGFTTMTECHGKPVLGPTELYVAMPMWHPAAYLRGNREVLGMLAVDFAKVETLLTEGIAELLRPAPEPPPIEWATEIGFLTLKGVRKSGRCMLCGHSDEVAAYEGEGLKWKLCRTHAAATATWAAKNLPAMAEHRDFAVAASAAARLERTAARMEAVLREGSERLSSRLAPADGASAGTEGIATEPAERSGELGDRGGNGAVAAECADGASESRTPEGATGRVER